MTRHLLTMLLLSPSLFTSDAFGQTAGGRVLAAEGPIQLETVAVAREPARTVHTQGVTLHAAPANTAEAIVLSDQENFFVETLGGSPRPRTLVIRTGEAEPKGTAALEEDLAIMSRILSKSLKEVIGGDDVMTAMGMRLRALAWSPAVAGAQNIYLDGYGAIFLLNVNFPLLAPPQKTEGEKAKGDSTWDEVKRELYGPKDEPLTRLFGKDKARAEFDPDKVNRLKDSLIQGLKNATNIRGLKPEEFVTITVVGPESGAGGSVVMSKSDDDEGKTKGVRSARVEVRRATTSSADQTIMTLRAKKSDIDNFAGGGASLEQFKNRVAVSIY